MKNPYTRLLKHLAISFLLLFLIYIPDRPAMACIHNIPDEDFRVALFQQNIGDKDKEFEPYYFSLNIYNKSRIYDGFVDEIELNQNFMEWKNELKEPFSKGAFDSACRFKLEGLTTDSFDVYTEDNSFIKALRLSKNKPYLDYFRMAKNTERFNNIGTYNDPWGLDSIHGESEIKVIKLLEEMAHTTKLTFIRERSAYLLCRLFYYVRDSKELVKVYQNYLDLPSVTSWVKASAEYYATMAKARDSNYFDDFSNSSDEDIHIVKNQNNAIHKAAFSSFYRNMLHVMEFSKDKRATVIHWLNSESIQNILPFLSSSHDKALALAAFSIRYPGKALKQIQKIYALDPNNKFLPLLLTREINKIEYWLLTPDLFEKEEWKYWEHFYGINNAKDKSYTLELENFVLGIKSEAIQEDQKYMALSHLSFLLDHSDKAINYCNKVASISKKGSTMYYQSLIDAVTIGLQQKRGVDSELKERIYLLLTELDSGLQNGNFYYYNSSNDEGYINPNLDQLSLKDNLLIFLGRKLLRFGNITDAAFILSGTDKPWETWEYEQSKNVFLLLHERAKATDFEKILEIVHKTPKTHFEQYFTKRQVEFISYMYQNPNKVYGDWWINWNTDVKRNHKSQNIWDTCRLLDLEGMYYVRKDSLQKALLSFQKIPQSFWADSSNAYQAYLYGNPFKLNLYHTQDGDSSYKNDPNKAHFIAKLIELKEKESKETNIEKKATLNYMIGNAYFSMGSKGKFWLMTTLSTYEKFNTENIALPYYKKAFLLTKDYKTAAFYAMYINYCKYGYEGIASYKQSTNKLLVSKKGANDFYKKLIKECPLYTSFRMSINS